LVEVIGRSLAVLVVVALTIVLSGCVTVAGIRPGGADPATARTETVFVASTIGDRSGTSAELSYAAHHVAVPPAHRPGDEPGLPVIGIDPAADFLVAGTERFANATSFRDAVAAQASLVGASPSEVLVFVHGFNTTLLKSLARMAQIGNDFDLPSAQVLYAWPTERRLLAYVDDARRAADARDGLIALLHNLAASRAERIVLVGHSMGAAIVVDALVRMRKKRQTEPFDKLDVVLLSPDLDLEQFRRRARGIGSLPRPIVVYGSHRDMPLQMVARFLADDRPRLGALPDPDLLSDVDLTYVDVANVAHSGYGHFAVAGAPALIASINAMPKPDLVGFATGSASAIPGARVSRHGLMTYILLPGPAK
jgi:esterase/lipase superfamily enzyme